MKKECQQVMKKFLNKKWGDLGMSQKALKQDVLTTRCAVTQRSEVGM